MDGKNSTSVILQSIRMTKSKILYMIIFGSIFAIMALVALLVCYAKFSRSDDEESTEINTANELVPIQTQNLTRCVSESDLQIDVQVQAFRRISI